MIATLAFVQKTFDRFNALCFESELPPVPIVLSKARSFLGRMEYKRGFRLFSLKPSYTDFRMKVSTSFDLPESELEDVVLHEMIHYYIALRNIRDNSSHGKSFRSMMERMNSVYGRHVTISHKSQHGQSPVRTGKPRLSHICVTTFKDGSRGVTVAAETKVSELHRMFSVFPDIIGIRWYVSSDPFFDRYPRSRTPKVYKITPDDLDSHLHDARAYDCDGRVPAPHRKG